MTEHEDKPASHLSEEEVRHIAHLSRLDCSDEEITKYSRELSRILGYAEKLNQLDTDGVAPTAHAVRQANVFREDVVRPSLDNESALANAPETEKGHFKVPQIIQDR